MRTAPPGHSPPSLAMALPYDPSRYPPYMRYPPLYKEGSAGTRPNTSLEECLPSTQTSALSRETGAVQGAERSLKGRGCLSSGVRSPARIRLRGGRRSPPGDPERSGNAINGVYSALCRSPSTTVDEGHGQPALRGKFRKPPPSPGSHRGRASGRGSVRLQQAQRRGGIRINGTCSSPCSAHRSGSPPPRRRIGR